MRRIARTASWLLLACVLVLVGFLAGRRVVSSVDPPAAAETPVLFAVEERTLERVVTLGGEAEWTAFDEVASRRGGTITWLSDELDLVEDGAVVATVDLEPIALAQGAIPPFRDLGGSVRGDDVAQLQTFLARQRLVDFEPDGVYGPSTEAAVKTWQEQIGASMTGVVALGDILWIPNLPTGFRVADGIKVGKVVSVGDVLLEEILSEPHVRLKTSEDQVNLLPVDPDVVVHHGGFAWRGILGPGIETDSGVEFSVAGPDGEPVCGDACVEIPKEDVTVVSIDIVIIPRTTGPAVPQIAIITDPGGRTTVRLAGGEAVEVLIRALADGMAVVDGLKVGQQVVLPEGAAGAEG